VDVVRSGNSSALEIAKRTGIHRTNVYDALRQLEKKGFIVELVEENKRFFTARDPAEMTEYVAQIRREVEAIIPSLKSLAKEKPEEKNSESLSISKGTLAIRHALLELLEIGQPIMVSGASKEAIEAFGLPFLAEFHKKRIKKKVVMNHLYHQDEAQRIASLNKMKYTSARYLPRKYDSLVSTAICGDIVLLFILTKPISMIKIKNSKIAETYAKYFDILYKSAA
jgi:sugar-specific transcriptional regulator TrmB